MIEIDIVSLFPEIFQALNHSMPGRAIQKKQLRLNFWNPRNYTDDPHRSVDDRPYGGGPGMLMRVQPLLKAIQAAQTRACKPRSVIHFSPRGRTLTQKTLERFSRQKGLILIASRYEGVDERLIEKVVDEEWSMGDYIITGGELATMVVIDGISRLLPNVLNNPDSNQQDSFSAQGLLDHPHYTRPEKFDSMEVPFVLRSGNHKAIARWRLKQALGQTWLKRLDLLKRRNLTVEEQHLLNEFIDEYMNKAKDP